MSFSDQVRAYQDRIDELNQHILGHSDDYGQPWDDDLSRKQLEFYADENGADEDVDWGDKGVEPEPDPVDTSIERIWGVALFG